MPLTPEQKEYKRQLAEAKERYYDLHRGCRHFVSGASSTVGADCAICGEHFGRYCPASPDHVCHYQSEEGYVELVDRSLVPVPGDHEASNESAQWCIFCQHSRSGEGPFVRCARCNRWETLPMDSGRLWCRWCNDWALPSPGRPEQIVEGRAERECPTPLTEEQEEYKRQLAEATQRYYDLHRGCRHYVEPRAQGADGVGCPCAICGEGLGWYCPASPDHVCHYDHGSQLGYVKLLDGSSMPFPADSDVRDKEWEFCIFCGDPYERK